MKHITNGVTCADRVKSVKSPHIKAIEERFPIHEHNENAKLCTGAKYSAMHPNMTIPFDSISQTKIDGFPIYITREDNGKLKATFAPNSHALIIGSTGSGKTTGFVIPFLNWMCRKQNKPTFVISDPKGELYEGTKNLFFENGYNILHFNFKDYTTSHCWNPLTKIFRCYQRYLHLEDEVDVVHKNGKAYNSFAGRLFREQKDLDFAILAEKDKMLADIDDMIEVVTKAISPTRDHNEAYWDQTPITIMKGCLWAMLEDSAPEKQQGRITEETYSFDTMLKIFDTFVDTGRNLDDHGYFSSRDCQRSKAYQLTKSSLIELSASNTRSCILSAFSEKTRIFRDISVRRITCTNTINLEKLDEEEKPTVIFVSYKDHVSLHYEMIGLFVADLYNALINIAERKEGTLERPCYFLLDEFGNFPRFMNFQNVISTCRSRNIWFFLIIQSYAQLYQVYEEKVADIIMDNLNMRFFYGSCNYETKAAFSKECGMHEVVSPLSAINGKQVYIEHYTSELVPLVPISRLSQLRVGECIITQRQGDVIWSQIVRSYLCPEYNHDGKSFDDSIVKIPFFDPKYTYDTGWLTVLPKKKPNPMNPFANF